MKDKEKEGGGQAERPFLSMAKWHIRGAGSLEVGGDLSMGGPRVTQLQSQHTWTQWLQSAPGRTSISHYYPPSTTAMGSHSGGIWH